MDREKFTTQDNFWYKEFAKRGADGVILDVEIDEVLDIKVEIVPKKGRIGAYLSKDLELLA